jgi:hypothetical protein
MLLEKQTAAREQDAATSVFHEMEVSDEMN